MGLEAQEIGLDVQEIGLEAQEIGLEAGEISFEVEEIGFELQEIGLEAEEIGFEAEEIGLEAKETGLEAKEIDLEAQEIGLRLKKSVLRLKKSVMRLSGFARTTSLVVKEPFWLRKDPSGCETAQSPLAAASRGISQGSPHGGFFMGLHGRAWAPFGNRSQLGVRACKLARRVPILGPHSHPWPAWTHLTKQNLNKK